MTELKNTETTANVSKDVELWLSCTGYGDMVKSASGKAPAVSGRAKHQPKPWDPILGS